MVEAQNPPVVQVDELSVFLKGLDTTEKFFNATNKYWGHGLISPHTVFRYYPSKKLTNRIYLRENQGHFYKPIATWEPASHSSLPEERQESAAETSSGDYVNAFDNLLRSNETGENVQALSGYYSFPKVTLNVPTESGKHNSDSTLQNDISGHVYHNYISLDDYCYSFGGLSFNKLFKFSDLGIPDSTPPEKISVYLPVELPPHIDRDMLMNPHLESNYHFHLHNPHRGTATILDSLITNYPRDLHSLSYTKLSTRHVFLYGGFYLKIKSVRYMEALDRWIIEKSFTLNETGFILDTVTFNFTEIKLLRHCQEGDEFSIGRLGNALIANVYEKCVTGDTISSIRVPTPSNYIDSSHVSPYIPSNAGSSSSSTNQNNQNKQGNSTLFKTRSGGTPTNHKTVISQRPHLSSEPQTPVSSGTGGYFKGISKSNTNSSSDSSKSNKKKGVNVKDVKKKAGSTLNKVMDKIHSNDSNNSSGSATGRSGSPTHISARGPSPLLSDALNQPMTLQSSYSNQVKQHRSNSGSFNNSRPVSPVTQQPILAPKPIVLSAEDMEAVVSEEDSISKCSCSDLSGGGLCDHCSKSDKTIRSPNDLFGNKVVRPDHSLTSIFVFGGFTEVVKDGIQTFKATNDFLRIDLRCEGDFFVSNIRPEAHMYRVVLKDPTKTPSARGFFASTLVEYNTDDEEFCDWNNYIRPFSPSSIFDEESSVSSAPTSNSRHPGNSSRIKTPEEFFEKMALLVHGGCNEKNNTFASMYLFKFATGEWEETSSYCYDYFEKQINPYDDDNCDELTLEKAVDKPDLIEAELRASHHTALYYNKLGRELVFFIGGFSNHYLRNSDPNTYQSDKFDVSRLARGKVITTNPEVCRMLVYNIKTQTWGFYKYQYDLRKNIAERTINVLKDVPALVNANIYHHGCGVSLNGKIITIFHGLMTPVAEKKEEYKEVDGLYPFNSVFLGCHLQISFPAL